MQATSAFLLFFSIAAPLAARESPPNVQPKDPELRTELLRRTGEDQVARQTWIKWMNDNGANGNVEIAKLSKEKKAEFEKIVAKLKDIDEANTKWLKGIVSKQGWPTISSVNTDGASAAWLLVQHADADRKFQRQCLDLMTKLPKEEISQKDVAYLTDRVLLAEGKKQLYGTQFTSVEGKAKPRPIEDEANVDKRRAEVGLGPIAEYAKIIEQQYGGKSKK